MCTEPCWQLFLQHEHDKGNDKRAQEDVAKIRPRLWVLSSAELHPLGAGNFNEYYVKFEQRHQRFSLGQLKHLFDLRPEGLSASNLSPRSRTPHGPI
jgi:hypothetical protein